MNELKQRMITNAKSYNKHLTSEFLNQKSCAQLMAWVHPLNRKDFMYELSKHIEAC